MKTNEFIKEVEAMGFNAIKQNCIINIKTLEGGTLGYVSSYEMFVLHVGYESFHNLPLPQQQLLFKKLSQYASTPIEEREEEKEYMYKLRECGCMSYGSACYLNWYKELCKFMIDNPTETVVSKTHFTHSWLKERGVDIEQLKRIYEELEVTE